MKLLNAIEIASQTMAKIYEDVAPCTVSQARLLNAIGDVDGCSQTALVAATGIDRSTLSDVVQRLMNAGLVKRKRDEKDSRAYVVTLTASGREVLDECRKAYAQVEHDLIVTLKGAKLAA